MLPGIVLRKIVEQSRLAAPRGDARRAPARTGALRPTCTALVAMQAIEVRSRAREAAKGQFTQRLGWDAS